MNLPCRQSLRFVIFGVTLAVSLACAFTGASGGGGQPQPTGPSAASATEAVCSYPTDQFFDVTGTYSVKGGKSDQTGSYTGDAIITKLHQNCYSIVWHLNNNRTRTGTLQMVGNIISGAWQEGDQSGLFSGTASDLDLAISWGVGASQANSADYFEVLTKS